MIISDIENAGRYELPAFIFKMIKIIVDKDGLLL